MKKNIIIMGVTGSGKSTIGNMLADELGAAFFDGDDFHSQANIDKMSKGLPLSDEERIPWLESIARKIQETSSSSVTACSALRKNSREILRKVGNVTFIFLKGDKDLIFSRLESRSQNSEHFMPPSLLDSQFNTLEEPTGEADVHEVSISDSTKNIITKIVALTADR